MKLFLLLAALVQPLLSPVAAEPFWIYDASYPSSPRDVARDVLLTLCNNRRTLREKSARSRLQARGLPSSMRMTSPRRARGFSRCARYTGSATTPASSGFAHATERVAIGITVIRTPWIDLSGILAGDITVGFLLAVARELC